MYIHLGTIALILITHLSDAIQVLQDKQNNDNSGMFQLSNEFGYPCENHTLVTADGYILQMERIPFGKQKLESTKPPVLLVPALLSSTLVFAISGPQRSLAFILADHGYDVWLLNYRGTTYSRKHTTLDADRDKKQYWDFSLQEIALYDIPAAVDHVLSATKQESLFYIGYSLGSGVFFGLAAENPDFNKKVKLMVAIGPALQFNNSQNLFFVLAAEHQKYIQTLGSIFSIYEVLPHSSIFEQLGRMFCGDGSVFQELCVLGYYFSMGYSPKQLDQSQIGAMFRAFPAGASLKLLIHVAQLFKTGRFAKFDYGRKENLGLYGQVEPPLANVSKITTPIVIFHGDRDALISFKDFEDDVKMLPSVYAKHVLKGFNHMDLMFGIDAPRLIFREILDLFNLFSNS